MLYLQEDRTLILRQYCRTKTIYQWRKRFMTNKQEASEVLETLKGLDERQRKWDAKRRALWIEFADDALCVNPKQRVSNRRKRAG